MNRRGFLAGLGALGISAMFTKGADAAQIDVSNTTGQVYDPNLQGSHPRYGKRLYDGNQQVFAPANCGGYGEVFLQKGVDPATGIPKTVINVVVTTDNDYTSGKVIDIKAGTARVENGKWTHTNADQNLSKFIAKGLIDQNSTVVTNNSNDQYCPAVSTSSSRPDPTTPGDTTPPAPPPPPSGTCTSGPTC